MQDLLSIVQDGNIVSNMKIEAGHLVRIARETQRRTGDDVARAIGVDPATLSRIEGGKVAHPPAPEILSAIEHELGVPSYVFLRAWGYAIPEGPRPTYGDTRLQVLADGWDQLTDVEKTHMLSILELNRRRRGLDGLDDIVQVISENVGRRQASG